MSRLDLEDSLFHSALFEALEERLALSADPLGDLVMHGGLTASDISLESPQLELNNAQLSTQANAGTQWSDVAYARANYNLTGAGQTVAVIDTGIAYDHVALGGAYGAGTRVVGGWDFAENDANPYDDGPAGFHGTHVAGIIGARDNNYAGVATGVDLVALRVFDDNGSGSFSWVEQALQWVYDNRNSFANPITTVNMSIGTSWNASTVPEWSNLEEEFQQLNSVGIFVAVSAGNSFTTYNAAGVSYPAASPYVVPVASVTSSGTFSTFSQRNARSLAAPGQSIMSTVPDYLYGADGVKNDWAAASGTSMAAPWVAGASTLVRQAMQRAGYANVNQDMIYNQLFNTADVIFDSVTQANYRRINLRAALDTIIPADDFGNTAATAFHIGNVGDTPVNRSGVINTTSDVDYFSFTATKTGAANFQITAPTGMVPQWQLDGGASGTGNSFTVDAVAGRTYTIRLGGGGATGNYNFNVSIQATNWGLLDFGVFGQQNVAGERWYGMTATHTGLLTIESWFNNVAGDINIELYNADRQLITSSATSGASERLDTTVTEGQVLWVKATGTNDNVTFRCTNLIETNANSVIVWGTTKDDLFVFLPNANGQHRVAVNGVGYDFASSTYKEIYLSDIGGSDTYIYVGTSLDERSSLISGTAIVSSSSYSSVASQIETITINAGTGNDYAYFSDTAGNDSYYGTPNSGQIIGGGYNLTANGFDNYLVEFLNGGFNQSWLYGSIGDDTFHSSPRSASLTGPGFQHITSNHNTCVAVGGAGIDLAILNDSAGNDTFNGVANAAALYNSEYYMRADAFDRVEANATNGTDTAFLFDTAGNDYFAGSKIMTYMLGGGTINVATGYDNVIARSVNGGTDSADLYDSTGDDRFTVLGRSRVIDGNGYRVQADNFKTMRVNAVNGGNDTMLVYDLTKTDSLYGRRNSLAVTSTDSVNAFGFERAIAYARSGNKPRSDVTAVDYLFTKNGF